MISVCLMEIPWHFETVHGRSLPVRVSFGVLGDRDRRYWTVEESK